MQVANEAERSATAELAKQKARKQQFWATIFLILAVAAAINADDAEGAWAIVHALAFGVFSFAAVNRIVRAARP